MEESNATEGGRGPIKVLLKSWRKDIWKEAGPGGEENTAVAAVEEKPQ